MMDFSPIKQGGGQLIVGANAHLQAMHANLQRSEAKTAEAEAVAVRWKDAAEAKDVEIAALRARVEQLNAKVSMQQGLLGMVAENEPIVRKLLNDLQTAAQLLPAHLRPRGHRRQRAAASVGDDASSGGGAASLDLFSIGDDDDYSDGE